MSFGSKLSGLSQKIEATRRAGEATMAEFQWPMGSIPFAVDDLKAMLRRGWRLDHLGREGTAEEYQEAQKIVLTLREYVQSLPGAQQPEVTEYLVRMLTMEPKPKEATR